MYLGNNVIAIIPARQGSKGVPHKNIRPFAGHSLLFFAIQTCREASIFQAIIVSTDSAEVAQHATQAGARVPFLRPPHLAQDDTPVRDVLIDTMERLETAGETMGIVTLVEPTCPLRTATHLVDAVNMLTKSQADSVVTVSPIPTQFHPDKAVVVSSSGTLKFFTPTGETITHRQQLGPQLYYRNGAAYAVRRKTLIEDRTLYGSRCVPLIVETPLVSIDTVEDFEWAEFLLRERGAARKFRLE